MKYDCCLKTYPLQVAMYHFLIVHVYEPPSDVFELLGRSLVKDVTSGGSELSQVRTGRRPGGTG